jgi:flagellar basal-body rod protein FlgG
MNLVTADGSFVLDKNGGRIQIPANFDDITFDASGNVNYTLPGGGKGTAGQLGIVAINRPQLLEAQGNNTFMMPNLAALGLTQTNVMQPNGGAAVVRQGALEQSNVDMGEQMTKLMTMERAHQFNARSLRVGDDMMNLINQLK